MSGGHYSLGEVRRSLRSFLVGKVASSAIGVILLLALVRALAPTDYGAYIIFLALMELLQLGSNAGSYIAASRYVPEARLSGNSQLLYSSLLVLVVSRITTLAPICILTAVAAGRIGEFLDLPDYAVAAFRLFMVVVFLEGFCRYLDLLFDSLLRQGSAQSSIVIRNGLRLLVLAVLMLEGADVTLMTWVYVEIFAAGVGCLVSGGSMIRLLADLPRTGEPAKPPLSLVRRYARFGLPFYVGQLLGMGHSGDTARLVLARLTSVEVVAGFGFVGAFAAMLRRYMPIFLFSGMLKPLFVVAHARGATGTELASRADMVFRLCLFALVPLAVVFAIHGEAAVALLSGGRFVGLSALMVMFIALVACYCARAILEMLASCYEGGRDMFYASACALLAAALAVAIAWFVFGLFTQEWMAAVLLLSELIFICVSLTSLRLRHGVVFRPAFACYFRLASVTAIAAVAGRGLLSLEFPFDRSGVIAVGAVAGTVVLFFFGGAVLIKPFAEQERAMLNSALGRRLFHW